jgi:hypothetical protein
MGAEMINLLLLIDRGLEFIQKIQVTVFNFGDSSLFLLELAHDLCIFLFKSRYDLLSTFVDFFKNSGVLKRRLATQIAAGVRGY